MATFNNGESGSSVRTKLNAVLQHADGTAGEIVFNEAGADVDFRVESDTNANALFLDGASGNLGLGVTPSAWISNRRVLSVGGAVVGSINHAAVIGETTYNASVNSGGVWTYQNTAPASIVDFNNSATGGFAWKIAPSGTAGNPITFTQAMTLDASGKLGIGVTSPTATLDVFGSITARSGTVTADQFTNYGTNLTLNSGGSLPMLFQINSSEKMRIDASGNLLVGTTSGLLNERIRAEFGAGNTGITTSVASTAVQSHIAFYNGAVVGSISTNGSATSYNTSSDYRLKEDLQPIADASSRLAALNPVNFAWKADGTRTDGFIAHEVQAVIPQAVTGEKDATDEDGNPVYQGIDQSKIVPLLTAALQEALAKIATLETRISALEA